MRGGLSGHGQIWGYAGKGRLVGIGGRGARPPMAGFGRRSLTINGNIGRAIIPFILKLVA